MKDDPILERCIIGIFDKCLSVPVKTTNSTNRFSFDEPLVRITVKFAGAARGSIDIVAPSAATKIVSPAYRGKDDADVLSQLATATAACYLVESGNTNCHIGCPIVEEYREDTSLLPDNRVWCEAGGLVFGVEVRETC